MKLCRIAKFILIVIGSLTLVWIISPATIIPPTDPAEPIYISVVHDGFHSRLVLPTSNGELIQYAYGDWNYFARNRQNWTDGLAALLVPTQGTFGRRKFNNVAELQQITEQENYTLLSFEVAQAKSTQLLKSLEERFNRNIHTVIENPLTGLTLVRDDRDYTTWHNSNHELVTWLEKLDCQVRGFVLWANFRVQHPQN
ncbi:MAG: hypothetical protein MUD14_10260 [Hydrococcus sp. Prado102]|jgi:hypothetical protein|nr:hypothetical protein [Hydrococcus sp. Prado102]